jgi:hypothetical protein
MQRKASCACGGDCPRCKEESSVPARLQMSQDGDALEREAYRAANVVMRSNHNIASDSGMQLSSYSASGPSAVPPIVGEVLRSPGQSLDLATRGFMEPRFGHDFSAVRIHTDHTAAESARAVSALAYTVGSNIVFGAGQFAPNTSAGRTLIAHELSHVVQQGGSASQAMQRAAITARTSNLTNWALLQRQTDAGAANIATPTPDQANDATPLLGEAVRARCIPLGCPLSTSCAGEVMALTDCGTGTCPTCPPGLGNLIVRSWCTYTGISSGRQGIILNLAFGGQIGPFCL